MAYAPMGREKRTAASGTAALRRRQGGLEHAGKVVFELQAYDWKGKKWVSDGVLKDDIDVPALPRCNACGLLPGQPVREQTGRGKISTILSAKDEVKQKETPPESIPEGVFDRLLGKAVSPNP